MLSLLIWYRPSPQNVSRVHLGPDGQDVVNHM